MSYGYMQKEVARLREDIEALVTRASQQDDADDAALRSCRKITFPNLRDCCTILGERSPCCAWEYLGALVRYRFPVGIDTRPF
jgi:hypothetical protein